MILPTVGVSTTSWPSDHPRILSEVCLVDQKKKSKIPKDKKKVDRISRSEIEILCEEKGKLM